MYNQHSTAQHSTAQHANSLSFGKDNQPLISVIVPVYNQERFLTRCIDSILSQTYQNLEVILVDDASTDSSPEIIAQFAKKDSRVVTLKHDKNHGVFQARITGADAAHGKYIALIDNDDYISVDWFRLLLKKAEETNSDIVVGDWCFDFDGGSRRFHNLDPFRNHDYELTGDDILENFVAQAGNCFSWWLLWDKLYRKDLWERCVGDFKIFASEGKPILWWENIVFSTGLWSRAKKVTNVHGALYFFYRYTGCFSAAQKGRTPQYIQSVSNIMNLIRRTLESSGQYSRVEKYFQKWYRLAPAQLRREIVLNLGLTQYEQPIRQAFNMDNKDDFVELNDTFYSISTNLAQAFDWFENIKRQIISPQIKIVSFDVFDTLIQRPLLNPSDIFNFLAYEYNKNRSAIVDFKTIRIQAEAQCRKKITATRPSIEDVTLDEIYDEIAFETLIPHDVLEHLKELEINLELRLCEVRKTGKELFDLALESGKKIIICSDMYLPSDVIKKILSKNGYSGYSNFYLSSEVKRTKASKALFNYIAKDLGIKNRKAILHIGDNWNTDVLNAQACGWNAVHLASAIDMFCGRNPGIYSGRSYEKIFLNNDRDIDYNAMIYGFPSIGMLFGMVANKFFDNPFQSFHPDSDFNASPYYIGYYVLGFELLGLVQWIDKIATERKIPTIHFVARDGYLLKKAFDMYSKCGTRSNYLRVSRKAMFLFDVDTIEDIYASSEKVNVFACTPEKLLKMLAPIIPEENQAKAAEILGENRFIMDAFFHSVPEFNDCLKIICEKLIDISLLKDYKKHLREYFSEMIKPGDYVFDVGYHGRTEATLANILGFPVNSFYFHLSNERAVIRQKKYSFSCECQASYLSKMMGVIREHMFMELAPSTIAYKINGDSVSPVFEDYEPEYYGVYLTKTIQDSALMFIEDFLKKFDSFRDLMIIPSQLLYAPFEFYMHHSRPIDRQIFNSVTFEDELGNQGKYVSILEFWNNALHWKGLGQATQPAMSPEMFDIYTDGVFMKLYKKLNRWFPKGGRKREIIKKITGVFLR